MLGKENETMDDSTIYALKGSSEWFDILPSLQNGEGRFGWSYTKSADLRDLKKRVDESGWDVLNEEEKTVIRYFFLISGMEIMSSTSMCRNGASVPLPK